VEKRKKQKIIRKLNNTSRYAQKERNEERIKQICLRKFSDSHGKEYEDDRLFGYTVVP
jgi:hypothetical protein